MRRVLVEALAVLLLLAALLWQLLTAARSDGLTNDELLYIPAGYLQLTAGDYRLNPVHPPLALSLNAIGLLGLRLQVPPLGSGDAVLPWSFRFLNVANDPRVVLGRARLAVIGLTLALAVLTWYWGRSIAGALAGLVALFAIAFHPSIVAHGHLATTDLAGAFTSVLAAWVLWRWLERPGWARAGFFALAVGLGAATRHSTLALLPVFSAVLVWAWFARARRRVSFSEGSAGDIRSRDLAVLAACILAFVPLTLWAAYGFHSTAWPDGLMRRPHVSAPAERLLGAAERAHLAPAGFVDSLRFQLEHARQGHPGYLLGERRSRGWWQYPFVAFAVKNTPGFLAAFALAPWLAVRARRQRSPGRPGPGGAAAGVPVAALWLGCGLVVLASASMASIQIGERYLLPLYPFACLLLGTLAASVVKTARSVPALLALAACHAVPTVAAVRDGGAIPYFNPLAGGREGGHRVLLDSNLDWGQDLPRLAAWMRREGVTAIQLAYQGGDDPARYGIVWEDLPSVHAHPDRPARRPFHGVVVVSPNHLFGLPPKIGDTYAWLRSRRADARAGVFFVYRLP